MEAPFSLYDAASGTFMLDGFYRRISSLSTADMMAPDVVDTNLVYHASDCYGFGRGSIDYGTSPCANVA